MAYEPFKNTKMRFATLVLTTSFIVGSIAGPLTSNSQQQCSLTCNSDNKKFVYEIGTTYIYKYIADTETRLSSEKSEQSRLRIRAEAEIEPISKCDYVLRLRDVALEDPTSTIPKPIVDSNKFRTSLEQHPLRFGYQDGSIKNLCPDQNDPIWVLNIKRGILSTFQNSMENLSQEESVHEEVDITGRCLTHYKITSGSGSQSTMHIKKSRDLLDCADRTDHYTSFQTNPYHPTIAAKTPPLVKSEHNCEQIIESGKLKSSICKESHAFQPFSNQKSGAISTTYQRLTFAKQEPGKFTRNDFVSRRTTLLFDHKYRELGKTTDEQEAEEALRELCSVASDDIRPEVPKLFSRFVHKLQELNYENLLSIYKNVHTICKGNRKAKKFLYDAVPLTGSDAGVTLMRDLILRHEISKAEADTWLLMLSFLPRPSMKIITAMMPLLDRPDERPKALLGVSALTYSYCKTNPNCSQEPELRNLVKKLVPNLNDNCKTLTDQEKETVIVTLKALGNIGHIDDAALVLQKCYENVDNLIEVRLAALDAFRRLPCKYSRESIINSYFNHEEDVEVRIGAYMAVMKCPTPEILTKIHQRLDDEEVNQVGSFVWTHLTSLKETSDPYKQEIRKILSSKKLQKKFSTDVRKFSRYYEGSIFFDSLKTGAMAEGTMVFSPKSYLPRSASLGLTIDVFGESINLFEVGGRVEGFEYLVESFFGPKGYFPDDTIKNILESAREKKSYNEDKIKEIAKIFNVKQFSGEDPRGSMFMRIFGNEIGVLQFRGIEQLLQRSTAGFNIIHELIQLTQKEDSEYTKSFMFIDSSLIIPTSVGLPLNLTVNGTANVNLKIGGKLDLSRLRSKSLQFKINIQPSAAVEIASSMVIDAFVARSGLKMVATMHTSTFANAEIILENGEILRAHIDVPKEKMEVFTIQNNMFLLEGMSERKLRPLVENQAHLKKCTPSYLSKVLGLQLCSEINYPVVEYGNNVPTFLLSGPMAAKIYMEKTDVALTSYNLDYRWDKQSIHEHASPYIRTGRFSLNTPGSTINRELTAEFIYNEEEKSIDIQLVSPIKSLSFNGKVVNDKDLKKLRAIMNINGKEQFSLDSELKLDKKSDIFQLTPSITLRLGGQPVFGMTGSILRQENKKYNAEITVEHISSQPITLKGSLTKNSKIGWHRYDADVTLNSSPVYWYTKWFMQCTDLTMASKGTIEYRWFKRQKQSMTFGAKSSRSTETAKNTLSVEANFQWSAYPQLGWILSLEHQRANGHVENTIDFSYGDEQHRSVNALRIQHTYDRQGSWVEHRVVSGVRILFPAADVDATVEFNHELTRRSLDSHLVVKSGTDEKFAVHVNVSKPRDPSPELIRGQAKVTWPGHQWQLNGDVQQLTPEDLVTTVSAKWAPDSEARAVVTVNRPLGKQLDRWDRKLVAEFTLPGQEPIIMSGDVLLSGAEQSIHGEAQLHGHKYRTFAEYHRPSLENVRILAGASLPSKEEYSASAEVNNGPNQKMAMANVLLGKVRRMAADVHLKREAGHTSAAAKVNLDADRHPNDAYHLKADMDDAIGTIILEIPTMDMGLSWNVSRRGPTNFRSWYEVWLGQAKFSTDIDFNAAWRSSSRYLEGSVAVRTPFTGFREVHLTSNHTDDGRRWSNSAQMWLEDRTLFIFSSNGSLEMDQKTAMANLLLTGIRRMATYVHLKRDGGRTSTVAEVKLDIDRHPDDAYRLKADFGGAMGTIILEIPTMDMGLSWNVSRREPTDFLGRYQVWLGQAKFSTDVDFKAAWQSSSRYLVTSVTVCTPFTGFREVHLSGNHTDDGQQWSNGAQITLEDRPSMFSFASRGTFQLTKSDCRLQMTIRAVENHFTERVTNVNVAFQLTAGQQIQLAVSDVVSEGPQHNVVALTVAVAQSKNAMDEREQQWNDYRFSIKVESKSHVTGERLTAESSVQLNTTFENFETLSASYKLILDPTTVAVTAHVGWAEDQRVNIEVVVDRQQTGAQKHTMVSVHLLGPFRYTKDVAILMRVQERSPSDKQCVFEVSWASRKLVAVQFRRKTTSTTLSSNEQQLSLEAQEDFGLFGRFTADVQYATATDRLSLLVDGSLNHHVAQLNAGWHTTDQSGFGLVGLRYSEAETVVADLRVAHRFTPLTQGTELQVKLGSAAVDLSNNVTFSGDVFQMDTDFSLQTAMLHEITVTSALTVTATELQHTIVTQWESELSTTVATAVKWQTASASDPKYAFDGSVRVNTPWSRYGPFRVAASYECVDDEHRPKLKIEYWSGRMIDVMSSLRFDYNQGHGLLTMTTSTGLFQPITIVGRYNLARPEKTVDFSVTHDGKKIVDATAVMQFSNAYLDLDAKVSTPFARYANSQLTFTVDNQLSTKTGRIHVQFAGRSLELSARGTLNDGIGNFTIELLTPFQGYERLMLSGEVQLDPQSDQWLGFQSDGSVGKLDINAFYRNATSGSVDAGFVLTSSIPGLERLNLGIQYGMGDAGEKRASIMVEKGPHKVEFAASCKALPEDSYVNMVLTSPFDEFSLFQFDAKFSRPSDDRASLLVAARHNNDSLRLVGNVKGRVPDRSLMAELTLTTPFDALKQAMVTGRYSLKDAVKTAEASFGLNGQTAKLRCQLETSPTEVKTLVVFSSPLEGVRKVSLKSVAKKEAGSLSATVTLSVQSQVLEVVLQSSQSESRAFGRVNVRTPFTGYRLLTISVEGDGSAAKKRLSVLLQKEEHKATLEAELTAGANVTEASMTVTTPIEGYERLSIFGKLDTSKAKSFHVVSVHKGSQLYQATWELAHTPLSYLEYKLQLRTPGEVSMLYANYNLNGANALTYDLKLIQHKTMMELSGRFWKHPNELRADGSVLFNTNIGGLIATGVSGRYDLTSSTKEGAFKAEFSGRKLELMGTATTADRLLAIQLQGGSSWLEWKTFQLNGTVDVTQPEKAVVQVKLTKNQQDIEVTGKMDRGRDTYKGLLKVATPFNGYESLQAEVTASREGAKVVVKQKEVALVRLTAIHERQELKTDSRLEFHSELQGTKIFAVSVSTDVSGAQKKVETRMTIDDTNVLVECLGSGDRYRGDFEATISGNVKLPLLNAENAVIQMNFDRVQQMATVALNAADKELYKLTLDNDPHDPSTKTVTIRYPDKNVIEVRAQNYHENGSRIASFRASLNQKELIQVAAMVGRQTGDFNFHCAHCLTPISAALRYETGDDQKSVQGEFTENGRTFHLGGELTIERRSDQIVGYATSVDFQSPLTEVPNIKLNAELRSPAAQSATATVNLNWGADRHILFAMNAGVTRGVSVVVTTSFPGYEKFGILALHHQMSPHTSERTTLEFIWSTKRIGVSMKRTADEVYVIFISPFDGFESLSAKITYQSEPLDGRLVLSNGVDQIEVIGHAHLLPGRSVWKLSIRTPFTDHRAYVLEGAYDFVSDEQSARLLLEGQGQRFETRLLSQRDADDQKTRVFRWNMTTPAQSFGRFDVQVRYGAQPLAKSATMVIQLNDRTYRAGGNVQKRDDGLNFGFETSAAHGRSLAVTGHANAIDGKLSGELLLKCNDHALLTAVGTVNHHLPRHFRTDVRLTTSLQFVSKAQFTALIDVDDNNDTTVSTGVSWNDVRGIQLSGRLTSSEAQLNVSTPFTVANQLCFQSSWNCQNWNRCKFEASHDVDGHWGNLEVQLLNHLPKQLDASFRSATSCPYWDQFRAGLAFSNDNNGRMTNGKFDLQTPFEVLPEMKANFRFRNNDGRTRASAELQLPSSRIYSLEAVADSTSVVNSTLTLVVKTPHQNYEEITLKSSRFYVDSAERGTEWSLTTPTSRHAIQGSFTLKPGNIGFEGTAESTLVPLSPFNVRAKYHRVLTHSQMMFSFSNSDHRTTLAWTCLDGNETSSKGTFTLERTWASLSAEDVWTIEYLMDKSTSDAQFKFVTSLNRQIDSIKKQLASVNVILALNGVDASVMLDRGGDHHQVTAKFLASNGSIEEEFNVRSPLLPCKIFAVNGALKCDSSVDANLQVRVGDTDNVIRASLRARQATEYEGVLRVEVPSLGVDTHTATAKLKVRNDLLQGELKVQTPATAHYASAFLSRSSTQIATQFLLRTPYFDIHHFTFDGHATLRGPSQVNSIFTVNFRRQTHRLTLDSSFESGGLDSTVKLVSPLLSGKTWTAHVRAARAAPNSITGVLTITMGRDVHKGDMAVNLDKGMDVRLQLDTPIWGIDHVSITSSLRNHDDGSGGFDADAEISTPHSAHSLTSHYTAGSTRRVQVNVTSPYLGSHQYSLSAEVTSKTGSREASLTVRTAMANHTITLASHVDDQIASLIVSLVTPMFNLKNVSVAAVVRKFAARDVEATLEVNFRGQCHTMAIKMQRPSSRKLQFAIHAETPLLPTGALNATGHLELENPNRLNVSVDLLVAEYTLSAKGHLDWSRDGVNCRLQMDTPYLGPMEFTADIVAPSVTAINANVSFKTPASYHGLNVQFLLRHANISFRGKVQSSLLPWESLALAADVSVHWPSHVVAGFAAETPGRNFRFFGNYLNQHTDHVEGGFTIVTPFQTLPLLGVHGMLAKDAAAKGFSSNLEMRTREDGPPQAALYIKCAKDADGNSLTTAIWQMPVLNFRDVAVHYGTQMQNQSNRYGIAKLEVDDWAYGYEGQLSKTQNGGSVHAKVYAGTETLSLRTAVVKMPNERKLNFLLELPIEKLRYVSYEGQYSFDGRGHYAFTSVLKGSGFKYDFSGVLNCTDSNTLDGSVSFEMPLSGHEKVTLKMKHTHDDHFLQWIFELLRGDQTVVRLLLENTHRWNAGDGKLQLTTPFQPFKTASVIYKYDHLADHPSGNLGVSHNGQTLLQINALYRNDVRTVEVLNPIQPIVITYSYTISDNLVKIRGDYCWDTNQRSKATVGFDIAVTTTPRGIHLVLSSIHPVKPMTLTVTTEVTPTLLVHRAEIASVTTAKSVFYEVRSQKIEDRDGNVLYDTNLTVSIPSRTVQVLTHYETDYRKLLADARIKWDAFRDDSKEIGLQLNHYYGYAGFPLKYRTDVSYRYPKLDQILGLSMEYGSSPKDREVFSGQCKLNYGKTTSEAFTIRSRITNTGDSPTFSGYAVEVGAVHPASNLDVNVISHWNKTVQDVSGDLNLFYLSRQGEMKHMEVRSKISTIRKRVEMMIKSHLSKLEMSAEVTRLSRGYLLHLESQKDNLHPVTADFNLHLEEVPIAEFNAVYNSGIKRRFNIRAGMQDKKTILMKAYHENDIDMMDDMNLLVNLNQSRELVTRFYWRPGLLEELEQGVNNGVRTWCKSIRTAIRELTEEASIEFIHHSEKLQSSFSKAMSPIVTNFASELEELNKDVKIVKHAIHETYLHNDFYLKSIFDAVDASGLCKYICESVMTFVQSSVKCLQTIITSTKVALLRLQDLCDYICNHMTTDIHAHIQDIPYAIMHFSGKLNDFTSRTINDIALHGLKLIKDLICYWIPPINSWKIVTPEWIHQISNKVSVQLRNYLEKFIGSYYFETVKHSIDQILTCLQNLHNSEFLQKAHSWCRPIIRLLENCMENFWNHSYTRNLGKVAQLGYEMGIWAYDFFKIEDRARDLLGTLISRIEDVVLFLVQEMILPKYHLPSLRNEIVFEPQNGKLEISQTLPIMWNSFTELPSLYASPEYRDVMKFKDSLIRLPKQSLQKLYHAMRSEFTWNHLVPPFRGRALLVGDQHYMTFDGRAYEFAGSCSYLLAHDFMDNNFTAIVQYDRDANDIVEKTFTLVFNGDTLELHQNLTVTIGGHQQELPLFIGSTRISRNHHTVSIRNDAKQVWAFYEKTYDTFVLEIGGFYHGKTAGLFGTYDHEPFNDFTTHEQKKTSNIEEFSTSWEVSSKTCKSRKNHAHLSMTNSYAIQKTCNDLFSEYGMLTPCLRKINPNPYKNMCMNDVSAGKIPCAAVSAYVMMCKMNGILATMPDACLDCKIGSKIIPQGNELTLEGADVPQSVDIVFVIDNTWQCSTTFPNLRHKLSIISRNIEGALSGVPLKDNRYAVVGFGVGAPYTPQVITANGEIFAGLESIDLALNNTHFSAGHHHQVAELIEFATELPFRPGVGKVMIVVPCAEPTELYKYYSKLLNKLKELDIILHVTSIHEPILSAINKIKLEDIAGIDQDTAYTLKSSDRGTLAGDKTTRQQMTIPKNTLTSLALDTNGSIFFTSRLHSDKPAISKLATEIFTRRIAQNASPTNCQSCLCSTRQDGSPRALCSRCISDNSS